MSGQKHRPNRPPQRTEKTVISPEREAVTVTRADTAEKVATPETTEGAVMIGTAMITVMSDKIVMTVTVILVITDPIRGADMMKTGSPPIPGIGALTDMGTETEADTAPRLTDPDIQRTILLTDILTRDLLSLQSLKGTKEYSKLYTVPQRHSKA